MTKFVLLLLAIVAMPLCAQAVTIDLVTVGNPGNAGESFPGLFVGNVAKTYRIAKTEVTNSQYVEFLNAKAATDTFQLYNDSLIDYSAYGAIVRNGSPGSYTYAVKATATGMGPGGSDYTYGDKPVAYVTWYSAIRFANWMSNGQGSGGTESGAYTLTGGTPIPSNANTIFRNAGANWYLPTENEWYKAAYYDGSTATYYDYPTHSDTTPNNELPSSDSGNSANFLVGSATTTGDLDHPMTSAGAYTLSESYYQTRDQGGSVEEWNETLASTGIRVRRGGAWSQDATHMISSTRDTLSASGLNNATGFRLAAAAAAVNVAGDYNGNGIVDAADYVVWRAHNGQMYQLNNEVINTSPGTVNQDDYTAWRARFGNTSGSGAASLEAQAVPEPAAIAMAILCATIAFGATARSRAQVAHNRIK